VHVVFAPVRGEEPGAGSPERGGAGGRLLDGLILGTRPIPLHRRNRRSSRDDGPDQREAGERTGRVGDAGVRAASASRTLALVRPDGYIARTGGAAEIRADLDRMSAPM